MTKSLGSNNLGELSVEDCNSLSITDLLKDIKTDYMRSVEGMSLNVSGETVRICKSTLVSGGVRYWLECPSCKGKISKLRVLPDGSKVGCRRCLGLLYRKQRYKGMAEEPVVQIK